MNRTFLPMRKNTTLNNSAPRWSAIFAAITALFFVAAINDARAQFTFASDSSTNSAYSDGWGGGDNGGFGFNGWTLNSGAPSGNFAGNYTTGTANNGVTGFAGGGGAFMQFAKFDNSGVFAEADRSLSSSMGIGDTFSFQWGVNWDSGNGNGNKGFNIYVGGTGGTQVINMNIGGSSTITLNGTNVLTGFGTSAMTINITRDSASQLTIWTAAGRDGGAGFTNTLTGLASSAVDAFRFYTSRQNDSDNRNNSFNNFSITNSGVYSVTQTESRALTGGGALVVSNSSTLTLTSNGNTFTGGTTIQAGSTLSVGGGGGTGDIAGSIANAGTLTFNRTGTLNSTNAISGNGAVTKSGSGQVNLAVSNSYNGATTISAGSLEAQNAHALGSTTGSTTVNSGANLKLFGGGSGISYASEALTINGFGPAYDIPAEGDSGALRSVGGGNNTWNGTITLGSNSRINSDSAGGAGSLNLAGSINGGNNVLYVGSRASQLANMTISGTLSGAGGNADGITTSLYKSSANTLTITGTQNYTGATRITAGTLIYNGTNTSTAVRVQSGATLAGTGSVGATTILSGGTMSPGSSPGTQTYSSLVWEGGGNYNWQIYDAAGAAGTGYDTFTTGAFTINATTESKFNINLWSLSGIGPDTNGSAINFSSTTSTNWTLGTFTSITGFAADKFTINTTSANGTSGFANTFGGSFSINTNSTQLLLVYTAPVSNYTVTVNSGAVDQGAGAGITGGTNLFTGVGASLTKVGAGTLIMTNSANDYTGSTTIAEGAISINVAAPSGSVGALGNATTAVAVGTSTNAVATGFNFGAAVENGRSLNVIAGNAAGGTRAISTSFGSGTATQSGGVSLGTNTSITAANGSTLLISGALSGSGGANINGAGVVILSNNSTSYNGTVTLSSGSTLRAANNGALGTGGLTLNGGTLTTDGANARILANNITIGGNVAFGDGSGTGNLTLNGTVALGGAVRTLTVANNTTLGGAIGGTAGNGLTKAGNGTLTLSGANSFDGAVTINAGRLNVGGSSAIGNNAAVTVASGATFGLNALEEIGSLTGAGNVSLGGLLIAGNNGTSTTYSGVMSGTDGFVKKGAGTMTLSGANNYSGETFIVGGAALYSVAQGANFTNNILLGETNGTVSASLLLGATLNNPLTVRFGSSNNTLAVASSGAGAVTYGGNVNLFNNNFTIGQTAGGTGSVTFGSSTNTFFLGDDGGVQTRTVTVNGSHTIGAVITGGANNRIAVTGGGTLNLTAANTFTGGAQVTDGAIRVGNNAALGTGAFTFNFNSGTGSRVLASSSSTGYTLNNDFNVFDNSIILGQTEGGTGSLVLGGVGKNFNLGDDGEVRNRVITVHGSHTIAGNVTGGANNNIVKQGLGTLTLSGATNNFGGAVFIDSGVVNLAGGALTGDDVLDIGGGVNASAINTNNATLRISATNSYGRNIVVNAETNASGVSGNRFIEFAQSTGTGTLTGTVALEKTVNADVSNSAATGVLSGVISGVGGITKTGAGTLTLSGAAANSYSGLTTVSAGTLELNKATGNAIVGNVTVNSGAVLLLSGSNQVDSGATDVVTLSGGTIKRASGVSEVFGDLNLTAGSFLDFSGGTGGTIEFSGLDYTPSALLSLQLMNFTQGNTLIIRNTSNWGSQIGTGFTFGGTGGFGGSTFSDGTFTITAIPEPSTYLAAAGLIAMFLWPVRRRLIKDAKSILGLRAPARERIEAYRNA